MKTSTNKKNKLAPEQSEELLKLLKTRFEKNSKRHKGIDWEKVEAKLIKSTDVVWTLNEMERTGGEPDVVGYDKKAGEYIDRVLPYPEFGNGKSL